jgi:hypothetical protein
LAGISYIEHKGKKILYEDYSGCNSGTLKPLLEKAAGMIHSQQTASVLALVNVEDTRYNKEASALMKEFVKGNTPYIKCSAITGMDGLKSVILRGIIAVTGRKNLMVFPDIEKAKDYLAGL